MLEQEIKPELFKTHFTEDQMKEENIYEGTVMMWIEGSLTLEHEALVGGGMRGRTWVLILYLRPNSTGTVGDMWREYSAWRTEEERITQYTHLK